MGEDYIAHYGTEGQKWHQRNYQYPDGTYTELGKERRRVGTGERRPMLTEKEKLQRREAYYDKKEAVRHGDVLYASKHINDFSNQELDDLIERYDKNKKIAKIMKDIENEDKLTMEKVAKKLETVGSIANSSATIFKSLNTIHKSVHEISDRSNGSNKKSGGDKKKDDNRKEKNESKEKKSNGGLLKFLYHDHMQEKARRIDYQNDAKHTHYEMEKRFRKEDEEEEKRKKSS